MIVYFCFFWPTTTLAMERLIQPNMEWVKGTMARFQQCQRLTGGKASISFSDWAMSVPDEPSLFKEDVSGMKVASLNVDWVSNSSLNFWCNERRNCHLVDWLVRYFVYLQNLSLLPPALSNIYPGADVPQKRKRRPNTKNGNQISTATKNGTFQGDCQKMEYPSSVTIENPTL